LGGKGGTGQVKRHAFFKHVSWEAVLNKKVIPPIRPCEDGGREGGRASSTGSKVSGSSRGSAGGGGREGGVVACNSPVCRLQGNRHLGPSSSRQITSFSTSSSPSPAEGATAAGKKGGGRHPLNDEEGEEGREGGGEECQHEYVGTENFEKEFTGMDVASAFEVLEPLSPHSNAIFANFTTEPTIRVLRPKGREGGREGKEGGRNPKRLTFKESEEEIGPFGGGRREGGGAVVSAVAGAGGRGGGRGGEKKGPSGA